MNGFLSVFFPKKRVMIDETASEEGVIGHFSGRLNHPFQRKIPLLQVLRHHSMRRTIMQC
jgi:hypothetical protein